MDRLKILVVDDEMLIRKLIRMKIESLELDVEIVGEYGDASGALKGVEELHPDIVLSDICMPGEDGISFSALCIKRFPDIKIIIITGFNDFDYARRSIKAGVSDYIMKPVQSAELRQAICHVRDEILEKRIAENKKKLLEDELKSSIPVLQNSYLNKLLSGDESAVISSTQLEELSIPVSVIKSFLRIGLLAMRETIENPDLPLLAEKESKSFFFGEENLYIVRDSWGRIVIISCNPDFPMEQCLDMLLELIKTKFNCHIMRAASNVFEGLSELRKAYLDAINMLSMHHSQSDGMERDSEVFSESSSTDYVGLFTVLEESGKIKEARKLLREFVSETNEDISEETAAKRIALIVRELGRRRSPDWSRLENENPIGNYHNKEELLWWVDERTTKLLLLRQTGDSPYLMLQDAVKYLKDNIVCYDLNQNALASKYNVSSSHFGRLMKQYLGITYSDIVSEIRLSTMIRYLHETDMKDRDIGTLIGIEDAHYLSIWFKKMTGYSVSEYRKKYGLI